MSHTGFSRPVPEDARPPTEVKLMDAQVQILPDGARLSITITITPFQEKPSLELTLRDANGREISHTYIIETPDEQLKITMHLRGYVINEPIPLDIQAYYPELGVVDEQKIMVLPITPQ